ncbi:MAG: hypothetical protein LBU32_23970 [Clostridiales bacterium]|nr:hypothetical protein [Clostridiales bacterium]
MMKRPRIHFGQARLPSRCEPNANALVQQLSGAEPYQVREPRAEPGDASESN